MCVCKEFFSLFPHLNNKPSFREMLKWSLSLSLSVCSGDSWAGAPQDDMCYAKVFCDWSHVIDVQLKAIKVFCLLVNFPFSRPVRAVPKPWALWTGLMLGLKSVLGSLRGDEGGSGHAADQMSPCWSEPQSALPGDQLLGAFGKEQQTNTLKKGYGKNPFPNGII